MKDKEKQIEEMARVLSTVKRCEALALSECIKKKCEYPHYEGVTCIAEHQAETLYKQGYRKLSEDSVIIPKSEYNKLTLLAKECIVWRGKNCNTASLPKEDSVVLSMEEYNQLVNIKKFFETAGSQISAGNLLVYLKEFKEETSKETAEKYYTLMNDCIKSNLNIRKNKNTFAMALSRDNDELAKQFGVEIKE